MRRRFLKTELLFLRSPSVRHRIDTSASAVRTSRERRSFLPCLLTRRANTATMNRQTLKNANTIAPKPEDAMHSFILSLKWRGAIAADSVPFLPATRLATFLVAPDDKGDNKDFVSQEGFKRYLMNKWLKGHTFYISKTTLVFKQQRYGLLFFFFFFCRHTKFSGLFIRDAK